MSGFIEGEIELSRTSAGDARFRARIGQEHFERLEDGTFKPLPTTYHMLVQYRRAAERAFAQFKPGDHFVAEGYIREFEREKDGQMVPAEEFVAKKLGHDTARTTYDVTRRPTPPDAPPLAAIPGGRTPAIAQADQVRSHQLADLPGASSTFPMRAVGGAGVPF